MAKLGTCCFLFFSIILYTATTVHSEACRPLWTQFQNHCYRFFGEAKNWEDAEFYCRQFATREQCGHLVSIHNEDENTFVYELWQTSLISGAERIPGLEDRINRGNSLWIGSNDRETEGSRVWSDNTLIDFLTWRSGEPNNWDWNGAEPHGEDCDSMNINANTKQRWNDAPCDFLFPFICKLPTE